MGRRGPAGRGKHGHAPERIHLQRRQPTHADRGEREWGHDPGCAAGLDGTAIIEERLATGEVNRFFSDGEQHNGIARYLTRDHLGSIREVTDSAGTVVTRNDYDPYGRLTRIAGSEDSRFGFTSHLAHPQSGLALAPYRAYDPTFGRWLSNDPARYVDGPNLMRTSGTGHPRCMNRSGCSCRPSR